MFGLVGKGKFKGDKRTRRLLNVLFGVGVLVFLLGVVSVFLHVTLPSPVPLAFVEGGLLYYFWPFLNWVTIVGFVLAVVCWLSDYLMGEEN